VADATAFSDSLRRDVTGEVEDQLGRVCGEGVDGSVGVGTMAMLEVTAPSLAFSVDTPGSASPTAHSVR